MLYENYKNKLLIISVLFLLMGVAFMVYPADSMVMLVRLTGVFLLLLGLMILIPSLRDRKELGLRFWALLIVAVAILACGVVLLVKPDSFVEAFWIILGVILILDGIKNFTYLSAVPFKLITILLSIVSIVCGVLIVTHPFGSGMAYMIVIGAFFAYSGAAGVFMNIAGKIQRKAASKPEAIEEAEVVETAEDAAEDAEVADDAADASGEAEAAAEEIAEGDAPETEASDDNAKA